MFFSLLFWSREKGKHKKKLKRLSVFGYTKEMCKRNKTLKLRLFVWHQNEQLTLLLLLLLLWICFLFMSFRETFFVDIYKKRTHTCSIENVSRSNISHIRHKYICASFSTRIFHFIPFVLKIYLKSSFIILICLHLRNFHG